MILLLLAIPLGLDTAEQIALGLRFDQFLTQRPQPLELDVLQ